MSERAALLTTGAACFARGAYFEAHEHWEDAWRLATGGEKRVIQGLIQLAAAFVHRSAGRPRPAASLLRRALIKLEGAPATLDGIDVAALVAIARAA